MTISLPILNLYEFIEWIQNTVTMVSKFPDYRRLRRPRYRLFAGFHDSAV
jgi:hypothetical protein